jgi:hypothetical protein
MNKYLRRKKELKLLNLLHRKGKEKGSMRIKRVAGFV